MAKTRSDGGGLSGGGAGKYAAGGMKRAVRKAGVAGRVSVARSLKPRRTTVVLKPLRTTVAPKAKTPARGAR